MIILLGKTTRARLLLFVFVLSACTRPIRTIRFDPGFDSDKESIVFGHLIIDWKNARFLDTLQRQGEMTLSVIHESSGETNHFTCQDDGIDSRFFATLPPGDYRWVKWMKGRYFRNMYGTFEVGTGKVIYVGTLKWFRDPFARLQGNLFIDDYLEEEARYLKERYPHIEQTPEKSIVRLE